MYETYVLNWALEEVKLKSNQYGGTKGCSTSHLLISVWQQILRDLEDCRAATVLTAIDYAKVFNRMSFQECLKLFARHGALTDLMQIIAAFFTGRKISVKVGNNWSVSREVDGGVPQGSILGVLLFNMTTDNLEDEKNATGYEAPVALDSSAGSSAGLFNNLSEYDDSLENLEQIGHSTPELDQTLNFEPGITPIRDGSSQFVFLEDARNVKRALHMSEGNLTLIRDHTLPSKPNPKTLAVWTPRPPGKHKYVDDSIIPRHKN